MTSSSSPLSNETGHHVEGLLQKMSNQYVDSCVGDNWEYLAIKLKLLGYAITTIGEFMSSSQNGNDTVPAPLMELIKSFPNIDQGLDNVDWLPLHWAVSGYPTVRPRDIEVVLQNNPMACRQHLDSTNQLLPIHILSCTRNPSVNIAEELVDAYPFSVLQPDSDGFLPLHLAAKYTQKVEYVQFLLQADSKALQMKTHKHQNCLHLAVTNSNPKILNALLSVWPKGIREQESSSHHLESPLFLAIRIGNATATKSILNIDPTLTRVVDTRSNLYPLHYAAYISNIDVVLSLLAVDPEVVNFPAGSRKSFPLHESVFNSCDSVFKAMLEATPCVPSVDFVRIHQRTDAQGNLNDELAQGELSDDEENESHSLQVPPLPPTHEEVLAAFHHWLRDKNGQHPIHSVMRSSYLSKERLSLILEKYAAQFGSYTNENPLGYAKSLLLLMQDHNGNTPLHVYLTSMLENINPTGLSSLDKDRITNSRFEAFVYLLHCAPESCLALNQNLELPLHCFAFAIDKLLGCCRSVTAEKLSTGCGNSPKRIRQPVRRDHACKTMTLLLNHTCGSCDDSIKLPCHFEARRIILRTLSKNSLDSDPLALSNSFLFQDNFFLTSSSVEPVETTINNHIYGPLKQHAGSSGASLLEIRNVDDENVYDLLTRSSVPVHISNSFNGGEHKANDDLVEICDAPAHQDKYVAEIWKLFDNTVECDDSSLSDNNSYSAPSGVMSITPSTPSKINRTTVNPGASNVSANMQSGGSQLCTRSLLKRLVLQANPTFNPALLRELNYRARRMGLFLGFCAGTIATSLKKREVNIYARLRR